MSPRTLGIVLALSLATASESRALADDKSRGEALFREARNAMAEQDFSRAKEKLVESQKLSPGAGTLLNLAYCYERLGLFANAYGEYQRALVLAEKNQRAVHVRAARERLAELRVRVALVTVVMSRDASTTPQLTATIDGIVVRAADTVALDEGRHIIRAAAPGYATWSVQVLAKEGNSSQLNIPALVSETKQKSDAPAPTPAPATTTTSAPIATEASVAIRSSDLRRPIGFSLAALGVAGIGTGIVLGLSAKNRYADATTPAHCKDSVCDQYGMDRIDSAKGTAVWATIATGAGVAAVAGGIFLLVMNPSNREVVGVVATPTPGGARVDLARKF